MKYFFLSLGLLIGPLLTAQDSVIEVYKMTKKITKLYNLGDEQANQYSNILQIKFDALEDLKKHDLNKQELAEQQAVIEEDFNKSFEAVLDPVQKELFQKHLAYEMKMKGKEQKRTSRQISDQSNRKSASQ